jgi:hypothetical protein
MISVSEQQVEPIKKLFRRGATSCKRRGRDKKNAGIEKRRNTKMATRQEIENQGKTPGLRS